MTKITSVEATTYSKAFEGYVHSPSAWESNVKRDLVLAMVTTSDGTIGFGEAHHALSPTVVAELVHSSIAPLLIGADPLHHEDIWQLIYKHQAATHGAGTAAVIAMSGVDISLWDLRGKILGRPVYELLVRARKRIRVYAGGLSLGFQPLDTLEQEVGRLVDQGYTAIKLRVGDTLRADSARIGHISSTFGDDLDIAADAATRYDRKDMAEVVRYCEENRVYWLEEPFAPDDIEAYQELRRSALTPLAAGENHCTKTAFRELFVARAIDVARPDCTKTGGITEGKKIAAMAAAWHLPIAPHSSQSLLSTAANLHVLSAASNALIYEADPATVNPFRDEISPNPLLVVDGHVEPNDAPGLGVVIDEEASAKHHGRPGP